MAIFNKYRFANLLFFSIRDCFMPAVITYGFDGVLDEYMLVSACASSLFISVKKHSYALESRSNPFKMLMKDASSFVCGVFSY